MKLIDAYGYANLRALKKRKINEKAQPQHISNKVEQGNCGIKTQTNN